MLGLRWGTGARHSPVHTRNKCNHTWNLCSVCVPSAGETKHSYWGTWNILVEVGFWNESVLPLRPSGSTEQNLKASAVWVEPWWPTEEVTGRLSAAVSHAKKGIFWYKFKVKQEEKQKLWKNKDTKKNFLGTEKHCFTFCSRINPIKSKMPLVSKDSYVHTLFSTVPSSHLILGVYSRIDPVHSKHCSNSRWFQYDNSHSGL